MIKFEYPDTIDTSMAEPLISEIAKDPMSGWMDLPRHFNADEIARIKDAAEKINSDSKYLVCIGVGGSYMGHRAVLEAIGNHGAATKILYIGNSLDPYTMRKTIEKLGNSSFSIDVISKSGTTLEPAIAFRIFKQMLIEKYGEKAVKRLQAREDAADFFMKFVNADCDHIAIENPVGVMSTRYRKPDQIIQPFQFGHPYRKTTCLWTKNLPKLTPTNVVEPEIIHSKGASGGYSGNSWVVKDENGKILSYRDPRVAKARSKTYEGIAEAIAQQWGDIA